MLFDLAVIAVSDFKSVCFTDRLNTHLPRAPLVLLTVLGHAASIHAYAVFEFMPESFDDFHLRILAHRTVQLFKAVYGTGRSNEFSAYVIVRNAGQLSVLSVTAYQARMSLTACLLTVRRN